MGNETDETPVLKNLLKDVPTSVQAAGSTEGWTLDPLLDDPELHFERLSAQKKNYLAHYDLDIDPFDERLDEGLFYPGGKRQQILDQLLHLSRFSTSLLLVTGATGVGKTTLKNSYLNCIAGDDTEVATVQASPLMSSDRLLIEISQGLKLVLPSGGTTELKLVTLLIQRIKEKHAIPRGVIVVIDDAQDLSESAISVLADLVFGCSTSDTGSLHIALFGDQSLVPRMNSPMWKDMLVHQVELKNFTFNETSEYLNYRLETAGFVGNSPFCFEQVENIYMYAQGNPRKILNAARDELQVNGAPKDVKRHRWPWLHFGVAAALGLSLLILYFIRDDKLPIAIDVLGDDNTSIGDVIAPSTMQVFDKNSTDKNSTDKNIAPGSAMIGRETSPLKSPLPKTQLEERLAQVEAKLNGRPSSVPPTAAPESTEEQSLQQQALEEQSLASQLEVRSEERLEQQTQERSAKARLTAEPPSEAQLAEDPLPTEAPTEDKNIETSAMRSTVSDSALRAVKTDLAKNAELRSQDDPQEPELPAPELQERHSQKPIPQKLEQQKTHADGTLRKTEPAATPNEKRLNSGERVLLATDRDHFTLQLLGSHSIDRITNFIAQQKNPERFYYFSSNHMGKRWYVVVYNRFSSKQQAYAGIGELPPNLQQQKPWVRSVAGIQLDIKKYYDLQ